MFKIQLREFISKKPNGDRDTTGGTDSSSFAVVLIGGQGETTLAEFSGYDSMWCSPRNDRPLAQKYLDEKAVFFNAEILPTQKYRQAQVTKIDWAPVED